MDSKECAIEIVKKLQKVGYTAYFAGGWVRDYLLDHSSSDIDIATNALPQDILNLFPHTLLVGLSFGVVIVLYKGFQFEVASFRKDISYSDGRKPEEIEFSSAREDASRRDFTINGMFYDPIKDEIFDYVGGVEDLKKNIIRCIGNPSVRFMEDRLRMIRAVRFACRFNFAIDQETQDAIIECAPALFPAVAKERIYQELLKMTQSGHLDHALIELHRLQLLPIIFPELEHVHLREIKSQVAPFVHYPKNCPMVLYLLALFPRASLSQWLEMCLQLKMSNKEMNLVRLVDEYRTLSEGEHSVKSTRWTYFYANPEAQMVLSIYAAALPSESREAFLLRHELRQKSLEQHITRVIHRTPLISAALLKENGIVEGKKLGLLLKEAEKIAIENDIHDAQLVLNALKKTSLWTSSN